MYKVVSECNNNEVWASGFYSKEKAQKAAALQKEVETLSKK